MNRLVVGAIVAMMPFTASFAGGVNVNLHNVAATKIVALPSMPRVQAAVPAMSGGTLRGLAPMAAGTLTGLDAAPATRGAPGPLKQPWFVYDETHYLGDLQAYKLTEKSIFLDGIGGMVGYVTRIRCSDCGTPQQDVQGIINTGLVMLGSGLVTPQPRPHFPPALESLGALVFGAVDQTLNTVGHILIGLGGGNT